MIFIASNQHIDRPLGSGHQHECHLAVFRKRQAQEGTDAKGTAPTFKPQTIKRVVFLHHWIDFQNVYQQIAEENLAAAAAKKAADAEAKKEAFSVFEIHT